jgi:hypothetical protein
MDRKRGERMPIYVWGRIMSEQQYEQELIDQGKPAEFPASPGVFALSYPYEGTVLIMDERCPAKFINSHHGRGAQVLPNVKFEQHPKPLELSMDANMGLQMFLQAVMTVDTPKGVELIFDYGDLFF